MIIVLIMIMLIMVFVLMMVILLIMMLEVMELMKIMLTGASVFANMTLNLKLVKSIPALFSLCVFVQI